VIGVVVVTHGAGGETENETENEHEGEDADD